MAWVVVVEAVFKVGFNLDLEKKLRRGLLKGDLSIEFFFGFGFFLIFFSSIFSSSGSADTALSFGEGLLLLAAKSSPFWGTLALGEALEVLIFFLSLNDCFSNLSSFSL